MTQALLVDTHLLVRIRTDAAKLTSGERAAILNAPRRYVSVVPLWEIGTLQNLARLPQEPRLLDVPRGFNLLPLLPDHGAACAALPRLHEDPFDRMPIAQARVEKLALLTRDAVIATYGRRGCRTLNLAGMPPETR